MYIIFSNHLNDEHFRVVTEYGDSIFNGILTPKIMLYYNFDRPREDLESLLDCIHCDLYDDNNHYLGRFMYINISITNEVDNCIEIMWESFNCEDGYFPYSHYKIVGWSYINDHTPDFSNPFISDERKTYFKNLIDSFLK